MNRFSIAIHTRIDDSKGEREGDAAGGNGQWFEIFPVLVELRDEIAEKAAHHCGDSDI